MLVTVLILFLQGVVMYSRTVPHAPPEERGLGPDGHPDDKLLMVEAVWRHGDRAPLYFFETELHKRPSWTVPGGFLSPLGAEQQQSLGQWIRKRYIEHFKFLDKEVDPDALKIVSTDYNRTIRSAKSNLFGMYGSDSALIPITVYDRATDYYGAPAGSCARLDSLVAMIPQTLEFKAIELENRDLYDKLEKLVVDPKIKCSSENIAFIWDQLYLQRLHNIDLDPAVNDLFERIDHVYNYYHQLKFGYELEPIKDGDGKEFDLGFELQRVWGGYLLERMISEFQDRLDCVNKVECTHLKYSAQSAHEITIAGLLSALGMPKLDYDRVRLPDLCSSVFLELWQNAEDDSHYVKLIYRRNSTNILDITDGISRCNLIEGRGCTWESFVKRSERYLPGEDKDLCLRKIEMDTDYNFVHKN